MPYTFIDRPAYQSQSFLYLSGERDYSVLIGKTGLRFYAALYLFITLIDLEGFYAPPSRSNPLASPLPWTLLLLFAAPKRLHSLILRLFNNPFSFFLLYLLFACLVWKRFALSTAACALALARKMSVLLPLPV